MVPRLSTRFLLKLVEVSFETSTLSGSFNRSQSGSYGPEIWVCDRLVTYFDGVFHPYWNCSVKSLFRLSTSDGRPS